MAPPRRPRRSSELWERQLITLRFKYKKHEGLNKVHPLRASRHVLIDASMEFEIDVYDLGDDGTQLRVDISQGSYECWKMLFRCIKERPKELPTTQTLDGQEHAILWN